MWQPAPSRASHSSLFPWGLLSSTISGAASAAATITGRVIVDKLKARARARAEQERRAREPYMGPIQRSVAVRVVAAGRRYRVEMVVSDLVNRTLVVTWLGQGEQDRMTEEWWGQQLLEGARQAWAMATDDGQLPL
jgi:hypothetical protein